MKRKDWLIINNYLVRLKYKKINKFDKFYTFYFLNVKLFINVMIKIKLIKYIK